MKKRKRIVSLLVSFMLVFCVMIIPVNASSTNSMNETAQEKFDPTAHGKVVQSGNCGADGNNVQYRLYEDGMLYIYGTGEMDDHPSDRGKWNNCRELYVSDGITTIGIFSFESCSKLSKIRLSKDLISINNYAFESCISLTNIELPITLIDIKHGAFSRCEKLTDVIIPNKVELIDEYAFAFCTSLKTVTIPKSATIIADNAFSLYRDNLLRIKGESGSYAETYAKEKGFAFIDVNDTATYYSPADLDAGKIISANSVIEKYGSYTRYKVEYYDKYDELIVDVYSKPYDSIRLEVLDNIEEWEIKGLSNGYGILNINGEISQGYYLLIELIDPLYKEVPEPTITPTQAPTQKPTPTPVPTQAPTTTPTQVPTIAPTQAPTTAPTTIPTQEPAKLNGWVTENGKEYWYENGVRQGYDPSNLTYRGKEIYDPASDAWYWLDNVQQGAKATNKDVYQESKADNAGNIGKWVRYDANGHMVKGWNQTKNGYYYFDLTYGTMYKGYKTIDGVTYYFDENTGITDRKQVDLNKPSVFGWVTINGKDYWYENGVRQGTEGRGKEIYDPGSDAWYWLDAVQDGAKAVSKDVYQESKAGICADRPDGTGKWVRYDEKGHMIKGWNTNSSGTYYFDQIYGTMYKGTQVIDGKTYHFDENTGILIN